MAALSFSGAAMVAPKWRTCTPNIVSFATIWTGKWPNFKSKSVPVALGSVDRVQFISRNGPNNFWGDPNILEKVSQNVIKVEQKWNKMSSSVFTRV